MLPAFPGGPRHWSGTPGAVGALWVSRLLLRPCSLVPNTRASVAPSDFITGGAGKRSAFPACRGGTVGRVSCPLISPLRRWAGASPGTAWSMGTCPRLNWGHGTAWLTPAWSPVPAFWRSRSCVPALVYEAGSLSGSSHPWLWKGERGEVRLLDHQTAAATPLPRRGCTPPTRHSSQGQPSLLSFSCLFAF